MNISFGRRVKISLILALLFLAASPAQTAQATDCSQIWRNGFPDDPALGNPEIPCYAVEPVATSLDPSLRMFSFQELEYSEQVKLQLEWIAEGLQFSVQRYRAFGRVPAITLVRSSRPFFADASVFAKSFMEFFDLDLESCPIVIYPLSEILPKEQLQQLVAHEVFHCVQKYNFKDESSFAVQGGGGSWWLEGLAQYFSNVVYPEVDFEYTERFPAPDQLMPFYDQENPYSSENFWQSYANLIGTSALFSVQSTMPTGGSDAPGTIAERLPRISEGLHEYAKQITRGKVVDGSGMNAPYRMSYDLRNAADQPHQEITLSYSDFTVGAYEVKLPRGKEWNLRIVIPSETKISFKKAEDDDYMPFTGSASIVSDCDSERRVQFVLTHVSDQMNMNSVRLVLDATDNALCDCEHQVAEPQLDQCLVGNWALDHSTVEQFWNRIAPNMEFLGSSGFMGFSITEEMAGHWDASGWQVGAQRATSNGLMVTLRETIYGSVNFSLSSSNGKFCTTPLGGEIWDDRVTTVGSTIVSQTHNPWPLGSTGMVVGYSCAPTEFMMTTVRATGSTSGQLMNYRFIRQ